MEGATYSFYVVIAGVVAVGIEMLLGAISNSRLFFFGIVMIASGALGMVTDTFVMTLIGLCVGALIYMLLGGVLLGSKKPDDDGESEDIEEVE